MNDVPTTALGQRSLVVRTGERFGVEPSKLLDTLKATAFKTDAPITDAQMMGLLVVSEQYKLNPFTKELFAFLDKRGVVVPYVSVDGWSRIVNEHPMFDGWSFVFDKDEQAFECTIWRKDRSHPTTVSEYMQECKRNTQPWNQSPRRMLRHKALMQCARLAFGFAGIYDEDEARRIVSMGPVDEVEAPPSAAERVRRVMSAAERVHVEDVELRQADEPNPPRTYAQWADEVLNASDPETAGLVLDEARGSLDQAAHAELAHVWRTKWSQEEQGAPK